MERKCQKCGETKELDATNFANKSGVKSGFDSQCKECKKNYDSDRYKRKRDKILKQKEVYYQKNKEKIKARQLKYHHSKKSSL